MGTQTRGSAALKNGGAPPMALKGGKFKDKAEREEYRRQINEIHGGPENAGKWLLLPPDAEVQMLGFSLQDSQFVESMQFDVEELCRWYGSRRIWCRTFCGPRSTTSKNWASASSSTA
jgi:phage portal protein BeeE